MMGNCCKKVFGKGSTSGGNSNDNDLQEEASSTASGSKRGSIPKHSFEYDLIVIGGGSAGVACARQAASLGANVFLCDFVVPTPLGTSWGIGGTCTNVGCVPKKLMHVGGLVSEIANSVSAYGFPKSTNLNHNWETLISGVQTYILGLNWNIRVTIHEDGVKYKNAFAQFVDPHTVELTDRENVKSRITGNYILIATGGRPRYLDIPGGRKSDRLCITSDDLFSVSYCPGKTLVVGASYVALECAGFLNSLGLKITVMVRSKLLKDFDQQMAELIGSHLEKLGVKILRQCVPTEIVKVKNGDPPILSVTFKNTSGKTGHEETSTEDFNTVLLAVGREPCSKELFLDDAGVKINKMNMKIIVTPTGQSSQKHIYAAGDVAEPWPELEPVAVHTGRGVANTLFLPVPKDKDKQPLPTDYTFVPTTIYTPLEYSCIGTSEEAALKQLGESSIEIYHGKFKPLEYVLHDSPNLDPCYLKLICKRDSNIKKQTVLGLHFLGPNAGEVIQGFTLALRLGATKTDFDSTIGIHPTCAEAFTNLKVTKASGADIYKELC